MLRKVEVTAYPTMGGMRGKQALMLLFMNPVFRGRTSKSSMALQTVGVSNRARAASRSDESDGIDCIPLLEACTVPTVPGKVTLPDYNGRCPVAKVSPPVESQSFFRRLHSVTSTVFKIEKKDSPGAISP